ncbi:mitochondrial carrier domain-containing protein [Radiomyces spectabilis]|uniref:mitochondrial carrier domain-containing protein n=1 Tax=Radiomyces spectabilis TaxID=64574 RepID=UPI002220036A|nr:mitochondrial carrier domain-containing protein [Radiomyces spectabilis]KAI8377562.1 mitochondrial carrier domain-containing protein [Radiomyces spectabilis]
MTDISDWAYIDDEIQPAQQPLLAPSHEISSMERMLSACSGALFTSFLVTPLDVVKTRLQSQAGHHLTNGLQFNGTWDGVTKIVRHEGTFSLWRGLSASLAMAIPSTVIYFVGYDYVREQTQKSRFAHTAIHDYSPLWAGGMARAIAAATISPIELFRTRLQAAEGRQDFKSVLNGVVRMVEHNGFRSLWRGFLPTMLRDVPFSAVYWMGYEKIKHRLKAIDGYGEEDTLSNFQISFAAGASSGMIAAVLTTPFDVLKTQRQVNSSKDMSFTLITRRILADEGWKGFLRGVVPRVMKVAPSCAIMISSYEVGKLFFADRRRQQQPRVMTS